MPQGGEGHGEAAPVSRSPWRRMHDLHGTRLEGIPGSRGTRPHVALYTCADLWRVGQEQA
ncbi:MAG: hypothetical protein Q8R30_04725 [bacterium]|nr:hypothetical protein [bacterium]